MRLASRYAATAVLQAPAWSRLVLRHIALFLRALLLQRMHTPGGLGGPRSQTRHLVLGATATALSAIHAATLH
jgi:hypothetical protein